MKPSLQAVAPQGQFPMANILGLDITISLLVLTAVLATLPPTIRPIFDKTHFVEVTTYLTQGRVALLERMAVEGSLESQGAPDDPAVELKGRYELSSRIVDHTYILTGKRPHDGTLFTLALAPSVIQGEPAGSVNWLCGSVGARAGWTGPVDGPGTDLSPSETPFVCSTRLGRTTP